MSLFDLIWVFELFGISYSRAFGILLGRGFRGAARLGQADAGFRRPFRTSTTKGRRQGAGSQHIESDFAALPEEMLLLRDQLRAVGTYDDWLFALEAYWRSVCLQIQFNVLQQMKALVPIRSGRLANSFEVICAPVAGAEFTLTSTAPYAHAVRFKSPVLGTFSVYGLFRQLLLANWSIIQTVATLHAYEAIGI